MYSEAIKILKKIEQAGFKAYIVGGFVRNRYLNILSTDIDICTSATPKDLKEIFPNIKLRNIKYGSITVINNKVRFEITTFRKERGYIGNRTPKKIKYIKSLKKDLKRRDFTVNTLCIDSNGDIIDLLGGVEDLNNKLIKMVGNPKKRLKEDVLRILRAIRFATILDFELEENLKKYIKKYGYLLKKLSFNRKKEELEKMFLSPNILKGFSLIEELALDKHLGLGNIKNIKRTSSIIGIWAQVDSNYSFSRHELEMINNIKKLSNKDLLENYNLYFYGLYVSLIAAEIQGISKKIVTKAYNNLPIKSKKNIAISAKEISDLLDKKEGIFLKKIFEDLEIAILAGYLENDEDKIKEYILKKYK